MVFLKPYFAFLCLVSENARKAVGGMLRKYEGDWMSFIKGHDPYFTFLDKDNEIPIPPKEVWLGHILIHISFWDMLALGQVNKTLNYVSRNWLHDEMVKSVTPSLAITFILDEDRTLTPAIMPFLPELLKAASNKKDKHVLARLQLYSYSQMDDLELIQYTYHYTANISDFPAVPEAQEIAKNLCLVKGIPFHFDNVIPEVPGTQYIWLPEGDDDRELLLERFDPRTVAAVIGQNSCLFRAMFFPHLIAQYILPAFHRENGMTVKTLVPLKLLMKSSAFLQYFQYLFRALYLHATSPNHTSSYERIMMFLNDIGFDEKLFTLCRDYREKWNEEECWSDNKMRGTLRAAQHWGLNWKHIAEKAQKRCKLSQRIMNGEFPEGLDPSTPITPRDVFKVAFCLDPTIDRPAFSIVKELVVLEEPAKKRKRDSHPEKVLEKVSKRRMDDCGENPPFIIPRPQIHFNHFMSFSPTEQSFLKNLNPPLEAPRPPQVPQAPVSHWFTDIALAAQQATPSPLPQLHLIHATFLAPSPSIPIVSQNHLVTIDDEPMEEGEEEIIETCMTPQQNS